MHQHMHSCWFGLVFVADPPQEYIIVRAPGDAGAQEEHTMSSGNRLRLGVFLFVGVTAVVAGAARADEQIIAAGTGLQSAVVIDTGANGICDTTAAPTDIQAAPVGGATPNLAEIRCGTDKIASSEAGGDDVQLIAVGATCSTANRPVVDTGPNGIPETALVGDDTYASGMTFGVAPANTVCVIAGADGVAQTTAPAGDDVQLLSAGTAQPSTDVIRCGPNGVADTTANNAGTGDDVQVVAVGNACSQNDVVVDSGPDGIATTRAEGPDLVLKVAKPVKVSIAPGSATGQKTIKLQIFNVEFGTAAPATRSYKLTVTGNSCGGGAVTQLDTDATTPGLQATSNVPIGGTVKASLVAKVKLEDVISTSKKTPFRCTFNVNAVALDTDPDVDDAANPDNNTTTIDLEVTDRNDL